MSNPPPADMRRHRALTDRNLLLGFFALLFLAGGGLIWLLYGGGAAAMGLACMAAGALVTGVVMLAVWGIEKLSQWLDHRE